MFQKYNNNDLFYLYLEKSVFHKKRSRKKIALQIIL